jgi:DNA-binding response OmpR family regulator
MGRHPQSRPVQILYIGRPDSNYDKVWQGFQQDGVAVSFARTQTLGLQLARELEPNIVVINTANSHFSGQRLCRTLARRLPQCHRVMIVERGDGPLAECEERLVRPFTGRKLRDTVRRLVLSAVPHVLKAGAVELDVVSRVVSSPLGRVHLTPKQCHLLSIFMQHPNRVISRQELMQDIWDTHYLGDTRTLDVHIRWLREKIESDPTHPTMLITKRGVGYKLVVSLPDTAEGLPAIIAPDTVEDLDDPIE